MTSRFADVNAISFYYVCQFDEGFMAGILYEYTHKIHTVSEIDCWANGSDACRFIITDQETVKDLK